MGCKKKRERRDQIEGEGIEKKKRRGGEVRCSEVVRGGVEGGGVKQPGQLPAAGTTKQRSREQTRTSPAFLGKEAAPAPLAVTGGAV